MQLIRTLEHDPDGILTSVDLDADGLDELAYVTAYSEHKAIVIQDPRTGGVVARWPR